MFNNCLLKQLFEGKKAGKEDEEEDVSTYWMASTKSGNIGNLKKKYQLTHCGELAGGLSMFLITSHPSSSRLRRILSRGT